MIAIVARGARSVARGALLMAMILGLQSCLFVKAPEQKGRTGEDVDLSPLPEITMGDELVRSRPGDMIALLPEGWLFLDTKNDVRMTSFPSP